MGDATAGLPCKTEQKAEFFFTRYCFVVNVFRGAGTRDELLSTSAWEAMLLKKEFFKLSLKRSGGGRTSYNRIQRIIKLWTLEKNGELSGVRSA